MRYGTYVNIESKDWVLPAGTFKARYLGLQLVMRLVWALTGAMVITLRFLPVLLLWPPLRLLLSLGRLRTAMLGFLWGLLAMVYNGIR